MSERTGNVTRTTALAVVMAAAMMLGMPSLNLGGGEEFSAVGSAAAIDVPRNFVLGVGELTADSLNTNTATMVSEYLLIFYCYSYLIGYDVDMNIIGDLATSWESSPDGLVWHFELVDNAYFCDPDNPTDLSHPVTASDVVYSFWEVQNHTDGRLNSYFPDIIDHFEYGPEGANGHELTLYLSKIHAPIMESFLAVPILPRYYWEGSGDDFTDFANLPPIGSGPLYYATDGLPDEGSAELARNPIWFQTENKGWQLHTDSWFIEEHTNVQPALLDLESGELDCYMRVPAYEYLTIMPDYDHIAGFSQSAGFVYEYNLNQMTDELRDELGGNFNPGENNQLLLDPTVKMAMAMAVDKDAFVNDILLGLGTVADSLIPPANPGHYWIPDPVEFDLTAARQLLWDAGWQYTEAGDPATSTTCPLAKVGGTDVLSFNFLTLDTSPVWEDAANLIALWAQEIGVELGVEIHTVSEMNSIWYSADYDTWLWDWVMPVTGDPSGILEVYTTDSIGASSDIYWSDPVFDALWVESLETVDPVARQEIFDEMQTMAYWNLGCQAVAYANDNYGVSTVNWDTDSLGDWNTKYMLLPDISCQWPSMQMYPNDNHAPYFTSYTGSDAVVVAEVGVSEPFTASGLDDDPTTVKEYRWFFGDGEKTSWSTSGAASHTYLEDGVYEAWVAIREASSSNGFEDYFITSKNLMVEVYDMSNMPPTGVSFTYDPLDPDSGTFVEFTGEATDPDGDDLYYTWDFGDGYSGSGEVVTHQYGQDGTFDVVLSVTDNHLGHGTRPVTYSELIYVAANMAPSLSVPDFVNIPIGEVRTYIVTASDPENPLRFTWDWGDGSELDVTTVASASHEYTIKTDYTLTVWADDLTGLDGHNVTDTGIVYTYNPNQNYIPVITEFSADDVTPSTWQDVTFTGSARDNDGEPLTFTIAFGDGTYYVEEFGPNSGEVLTITAEHAYTSSGVKTARLYVDDGTINVSTPLVLTVSLNYPPESFELDDISAYTGELVTVSVSTDDWDGDDLTFTWVWGDGDVDVTVNVPTASHTYTAPLDSVYWVYVDDGQGHNVSDGAFVVIEEAAATFTLELLVGWNMVTIPLVNHGLKASTLGLQFGDMVSRWDPATQTYDKNYIVGISGSASDFDLEASWGYWIATNTAQSIEVTGEVATTTQTRTITVPGGGGWVQIGLASLATDLWASDIVDMCTADMLSMISKWNAASQTYSSYIVQFGIGDFQLNPGDGVWLAADMSGVLSYEP